MVSRWLLIIALSALVTVTGAAGVLAFLYARQASSIETLTTSNKLLGEALDLTIKQRKIDDANVTRFMRSIEAIRADMDAQAQALDELRNDPTASPFLDTPTPDSVRKLFGHK